jgi:hypothetical protein
MKTLFYLLPKMFQSLFVFLFASQAAAANTCSGYFYEGKNFNRDANNKIIPGLKETYFSSTSKLPGRDSVTWGESPYTAKSARYSYNCQENLIRKEISDCSKTDCPRWLQYYEGEERLGPCKILVENPNVVGLADALEDRIQNCVKKTKGFGIAFSVIALVTVPPLATAPAVATMGIALTCRNRVCEHGLVGKECIKKFSQCDPLGLACCHSLIDNKPRQCKKNSSGTHVCR